MQTFFFYDLETSGLDPRQDRIMQFAGRRTDLDLNPIGDPVNLLVKLGEDTLPSPYAIMVTKITPQSTTLDGLTEAEFCKYVSEEIFTENTIAIGYNSVRFDDEFMRHTFWRNFYDAYEWQWRDGRSRWDMLDVVRLTRALRPEGINWPVTEDGHATNRLELITKLNGISHEAAHDALSDVNALIDVTRLIKDKQPKLYDYLFKMREKKAVQRLVNLENPQSFVYSCGKYSSQNNKTSVAYPIAPAKNGNVLVFDLRYNLEQYEKEATAEREKRIKEAKTPEEKRRAERPLSFYPVVKEMKYNHCPAVAPLGVLDQADGWKKIGLTREQVAINLAILQKHPDFIERMRTLNEERPEYAPAADVESTLYDGFLDQQDRNTCMAVRKAKKQDIATFHPEFHDSRLDELLLHYKARNFDNVLSESEQKQWDEYRLKRLKSRANDYVKAVQELAAEGKDSFVLEELQLWYQLVVPY